MGVPVFHDLSRSACVMRDSSHRLLTVGESRMHSDWDKEGWKKKEERGRREKKE